VNTRGAGLINLETFIKKETNQFSGTQVEQRRCIARNAFLWRVRSINHTFRAKTNTTIANTKGYPISSVKPWVMAGRT